MKLDDELTRRETLKLITASAGTGVALPILTQAALMQSPRNTTAAYVLKFFNPHQARSVEALSEVLIPADDHSPGAKAARVYEFIDEVLAGNSESAKNIWVKGLASIDGIANERFGHQYVECNVAQQTAVMEYIARNEEALSTLEDRFFTTLKTAVTNAYYTSKIGIHQDLEYQGNTMVHDFPGCSHQEHKDG